MMKGHFHQMSTSLGRFWLDVRVGVVYNTHTVRWIGRDLTHICSNSPMGWRMDIPLCIWMKFAGRMSVTVSEMS